MVPVNAQVEDRRSLSISASVLNLKSCRSFHLRRARRWPSNGPRPPCSSLAWSFAFRTGSDSRQPQKECDDLGSKFPNHDKQI